MEVLLSQDRPSSTPWDPVETEDGPGGLGTGPVTGSLRESDGLLCDSSSVPAV